MNGILLVLGTLFVAFLTVLLSPIVFVLAAALGGLIVQVSVGQWVVDGLGLLGLHIPLDSLWKVSVGLAFVGGYFKSVTHASTNKAK